jgi:hypothetical protein
MPSVRRLIAEAAEEAVAPRPQAQKDWAKRPLEDRVKLVLKGVARLNEMVDEVVPELAWQMGRPIRYGGEFAASTSAPTMWPRLPPMRWRLSSSRTAPASSAVSSASRMASSSSSRPGTIPT